MFEEFTKTRYSTIADVEDDDDCGEPLDVGINLEKKDEIWMLGPKVGTFIQK